LAPGQQLMANPPSESSPKYEQVAVDEENYVRNYDNAISILKEKYGSNFLSILNDEFKVEDWQAAKKLEHAVCFGINPADYGFSQKQAKEINAKGIVAYIRRGNPLPSLDLIRAYQNAIKNFCEDANKSDLNNESNFRGKPSITFFNKETRQVAIFNRETKIFITAYKLSEQNVDDYLTTGNIGRNQI